MAALPTARRGYDRRLVDALLTRLVATLGARAADFPELADVPARAGPPLDARDLRAARFPVVHRGYDMAVVDALLRRLSAALPEQAAAWDEAPAAAADGPGPQLRRSARGYDVEEVDAFLVRCAHSLGRRVERVPELAPLLARPRTGTPLRARDVETVQFRVRLGPGRGYDIEQVDALLDRIAEALLAG
ncbi:MAG TPA: DivIVA domain-containing protein [Mycobacteriales bacterium]|nr:DivIVA domain-containing protein [Mycobacteriales bacterium]